MSAQFIQEHSVKYVCTQRSIAAYTMCH